MKVWILTAEYNDYDQHGEYFLDVFKEKPSIEILANVLKLELNEYTILKLNHLLSGGGRVNTEYDWYYLREINCK